MALSISHRAAIIHRPSRLLTSSATTWRLVVVAHTPSTPLFNPRPIGFPPNLSFKSKLSVTIVSKFSRILRQQPLVSVSYIISNTRDRSTRMLAKLSERLFGDPRIQYANSDDDATSTTSPRYSSDQIIYSSPYHMSPSNPAASPFSTSPWIHSPAAVAPFVEEHTSGLLGSLVREEGHVYSLAASGDLLYTGSESKNIRIWKRWREFSGFKSSSGFVKAIVIADGKIFTGHQDGKIRVWKVSNSNPAVHNRVGSLPRMKDFLKSSINPANFVEVRRHRSSVWLRHYDAVSCLSLNEEAGLLYSGSWDKTVKVWRISDSRCLESITAHDDAINSVVATPGRLVYTGSADGTVKMWRRELIGRRTRHVLVQKLLEQESAVTALAVSTGGSVLYAGSSDGMVNWWRCGTEMVHAGSLRGHGMAVLCLAAAGSLVISGSADKTLCVWRREDMGDHTRLSVLAGHGGPVKCLAVEKDRCIGDGDDGWIVYSGSLDRSVKVWLVAERPEELEGKSPWPLRSVPGDAMDPDAAEAERRLCFGDQGCLDVV